MSAPQECDWNAARVFGSYLLHQASQASGDELRIDIFTDSNSAGCLGTRRSTECFVAVLGGAIVQIGELIRRGDQRSIERGKISHFRCDLGI